MPNTFKAFVGHKEACQIPPKDVTVLASSPTCPVQMIRYGKNVYATQFHPELDKEGLKTRIRVYQNYGYFPPETMDDLLAEANKADVTVPTEILRRFVQAYRK